MKSLVLDITRENNRLRISSYRQGEDLAHRHYTEKDTSFSEISYLCGEINTLFNASIRKESLPDNYLSGFRQNAILLYDQLLSLEVKTIIKNTDAKSLIFSIDEQLVQIPWELLHDGSDFLSLKFAVGRIVKTKQKFFNHSVSKDFKLPLKMLALVDPKGDLDFAYKEGICIRNELDKQKDKICVDLKTSDIDLNYVKKNIREYDVVHFAGHAEYNLQNASESGWQLKDQLFSPDIVMSLGHSAQLPFLIFSNACYSGVTDAWGNETDKEDNVYSLANAFLLGGVKYYIGTFWKVLDQSCICFCEEFYRNLRQNIPIGECLRLARHKLIDAYGDDSIVWASYMLYGDPGQPLFPEEKVKKTNKKKSFMQLITMVLAVLLLVVGAIVEGPKVTSFSSKKVLDDFEDGEIWSPFKSLGWGVSNKDIYRCSIVSYCHRKGKHALCVEYDKKEDMWAHVNVFLARSNPHVDFSKWHKLGFWLYGDVSIMVKLEDRSDKKVQQDVGMVVGEKDKWKFVEVDLIGVGIDTTNVSYIYFFVEPGYFNKKGMFFVDDIMLMK